MGAITPGTKVEREEQYRSRMVIPNDKANDRKYVSYMAVNKVTMRLVEDNSVISEGYEIVSGGWPNKGFGRQAQADTLAEAKAKAEEILEEIVMEDNSLNFLHAARVYNKADLDNYLKE